jgi:hypothetical protein
MEPWRRGGPSTVYMKEYLLLAAFMIPSLVVLAAAIVTAA